MNTDTTVMTFEVLLLNELLSEGVIDDTLYNIANSKLLSFNNYTNNAAA